MLPVYLLAFFTGFLSLAQEILWIRLFSFVNHSLPKSFAFVLIYYLIGIAIGSYIGKKICYGTRASLWQISGVVLVFASLFDLIAPWCYVAFAYGDIQRINGGFLILFTALLKAIIFPIVHHLGAPSVTRVGRSVSRVYAANIMGATLGPIVVSVFMLSVFTTQQCFIICACLTFFVGIFCLKNTISITAFIASISTTLVLSVWMFSVNPFLLLTKASVPGSIKQIVETAQGVITIYDGGKEGDIVLGGNVYDGRTNLDPVIDSNGIERALILGTLKDHPDQVLMIGLSIGTWLKLMTSFSDIKNMDVVEINPGYLSAIKKYPQQQSALLDPRVHLYIDDARRWLNTHPRKRYDLIIMNTTFYWRVYSTNLLSKEFLTTIKQHMNQHAIFAFNTTDSLDAFKTATAIFPHAYAYKNFVIAADFDWRNKFYSPAAKKKLSSLFLDGKPLLDVKIINHFLGIPVTALSAKKSAPSEVITDDNLITEYKHGEQTF